MKIFVYAIIGIVAVSVIAGFFFVGSPFEERTLRIDERRVSDLQFIQNEIISYWTNKQKLPEDLSRLRDDIRGVVIPVDPETGAPYEYKILGNMKFSLCATFKQPNRGYGEISAKPIPAEPYLGAENWEHGAGHVCFERTIDPDIYRPKAKIPATD